MKRNINLADEFLQAKIDYLQDEWDKYIVLQWKTKGRVSMQTCVHAFCRKHNIVPEFLFENIKRIPRGTYQYRCAISRFVAAYLPKLSDMLFSSQNINDEVLLAQMKKMVVLKNPIDASKTAREQRAFKRANKEAMAENVARSLVADQRLASSNYNWNNHS